MGSIRDLIGFQLFGDIPIGSLGVPFWGYLKPIRDLIGLHVQSLGGEGASGALLAQGFPEAL